MEKLEKSIYKSVKKALGTSKTRDIRDKVHSKTGKGVISDVLDPDFEAEASHKVPARRISQMNKSEKGIDKLREFIKSTKK